MIRHIITSAYMLSFKNKKKRSILIVLLIINETAVVKFKIVMKIVISF